MTGRFMKETAHDRFARHCFFCRHFYITYDVKFPYGCRAMGFKSKRLPSAEVIESSGMYCALYERKARGEKND